MVPQSTRPFRGLPSATILEAAAHFMPPTILHTYEAAFGAGADAD